MSDDFIDPPGTEPQTPEQQAVTPEPTPAEVLLNSRATRAQLAARVAELEALLAAGGAGTAEAKPTPKGTGYWKVSLEGAPTHVVQAPDSANAWVIFCKEMGITGSIHTPTVDVSDKESYRAAQAKRRGLKPEEFPLPDDPK